MKRGKAEIVKAEMAERGNGSSEQRVTGKQNAFALRDPCARLRVRGFAGSTFYLLLSAMPVSACELCAIYNADTASGSIGASFLFTVAEQYVSSHQLQAEGEPFTIKTVPDLSQAYMDNS